MRLLAIIAVIALVGCGKSTEDSNADKKPPAESITGYVIGDFSGKTAVKAGKRAKSTIEKARAQKKKDLEDVLGE